MKISSPILAFTLLSGIVHAGMFMMTDSIHLILPGSTGSVMSIQLEASIKPSFTNPQTVMGKNQTAASAIDNQRNELSESINSMYELDTDTSSKQQIKPSENLEQYEKQISLAKSNSQARAHVISIVYKRLNNHFKYPVIAQRHNWQGEVIIGFNITQEGIIENIKINRSSGFDILDQAAIISFKKIGNLPQLASGLVQGIEIQIPVIYQLTEG